ncbi:adenylosuccinate synthetase [[Eubacterium] cellulosolvens]
MPCTVLVGGFFGDEGKGKIISYFALRDKPKVIARGGVGPNAGHTIEYRGKKYFLRMVPSGFISDESRLLIGAGVLVNPTVLLKEIDELDCSSRIGVDKHCAIIEQRHIEEEKKSVHLVSKIGSTKNGIGTCSAERALRKAKLAKDLPELETYITDVSEEMYTAVKEGENALIEGTQGTYLSLYYGTYPFCTAKDVCASAICSDVGIGPTHVDEVVIVFKAYVTRVGEGPLEGELPREVTLQRGWMEYGTVTGRERRAAPFDFNLAKKAVQLNGATQIALTKMDIVFPDCRGETSYESLPQEVKSFVEEVEQRAGAPVTLMGTGPGAEEIIIRERR